MSGGWVRFENTAPENLKVASVSDRAFRLWFNAICYCSRGRTSGRVPAALITALSVSATKKTVEELLELGLIERLDEKTYLVHDYLDYNPSKERIDEMRETNRNRVANWRAERASNDVTGEHVTPLQVNYSHVRDRTDTDTSLAVDVQTTKSKQQTRTPSRPADQNEPPLLLHSDLHDTARLVLNVLKAVQAERGGDVPTVRGVGLSMLRFPNRDYLAVAREVEHWGLSGRGARKPVKDWARTFGTFLGNTSEGSPVRLGTNIVPITRAPHLERMDAWKRGYPAEGSA